MNRPLHTADGTGSEGVSVSTARQRISDISPARAPQAPPEPSSWAWLVCVLPWFSSVCALVSLPAAWRLAADGRLALAVLVVTSSVLAIAVAWNLRFRSPQRHAGNVEFLAACLEKSTRSAAILDADERIRWVNAAFIDLYGYALDELNGRLLNDVLATDRADRQLLRELSLALRVDGAARARLPRRTKDGRTLWIDHDLQRIVGESGESVGFVANDIDVTEEVELREALDESERRFHDAADATPVFIWALDPDAQCTYVNKSYAEFFGRPIAELLGTRWQPFIHPEDLADVQRRVAEGLRSRLPFQLTTRKRRHDGEYRWLVCHGAPHFTESGEFIGFLGGSMDVTEQRAAELEAQAANRAKSEFLTNMSHELRTPLSAILGYAEVLRDGTSSDSTEISRNEAFESLRRNGDQLLALIDDILDLSRIENGELRVACVDCDVQAIVEGVVAAFESRATAQGLDLEAFATTAVPRRILTDPARLRQILMNLVGNAVKFTASGSVKITLRCGRSIDGVDTLVLSVADTGVGMSEAVQSRLFRPFVQADTSLTRRHGGTGLGLSICHRLVAMLGGEIHVSSIPGAGSTFSVILKDVHRAGNAEIPAGTRFRMPHAPTTTSTASTAPLAGLRVLLAEDGPDNQRLIAHLMRKAGAEVQIAPDGRVAVDVVLGERTTRPFDLVLMDMQMPELDGYSASRAIRSADCSVPIVAITAHAMTGDREKCLAAGCDEYLTKPVTYERLLEPCLRVLTIRRAAA